jgi:putative hydrolase of the HAD superfamily
VESWTEYPDVRPALERLRRRDFKLGVVSNATDLLNKVFHSLDLAKYFDFVIISDEVGVRKPSPRIFMMAADQAGASPSRSIYLGDKPTVDIQGATRAGMNAILVDRANAFPDARCLRIRDLTYLKRFS